MAQTAPDVHGNAHAAVHEIHKHVAPSSREMPLLWFGLLVVVAWTARQILSSPGFSRPLRRRTTPKQAFEQRRAATQQRMPV